MMNPDYDRVVPRIQQIYNSCSASEKQMLEQILSELAVNGYSYTYEQIYLSDFKEVPVSIDQFLSDPDYLGQATNGGTSVFPYWRDMMDNLFSAGNQYNEIILSGATRIGKTSTAITIMAYMLYRLMLYRDPHRYFDQKPTARFTLVFANLTKELATGVAFFEFNSTIKESPWFMRAGTMSKSIANPVYMPDGDKINILPCSDAAHALGMQVFCLKGDTEILTVEGTKKIKDCAGTVQNIIQYVDGGLVETSARVELTSYTSTTIRIELEDGTIIEGTPDHRIMLSDGTYKRLCDLSSSDDLLTFNTNKGVDDMNLKDKNVRFCVYEHVSPNGKRYVGITSKKPEERWLVGGKGYCDNAHFWNAINKYGWDNFEHNILATDLSLTDACQMEVDLIDKYDLMNPEKGYNHTSGGNWSIPDLVTKQKLSKIIKKRCADPEYRKGMSERLLGHKLSDETKHKISLANKGRKWSEEAKMQIKGRKLSSEHIAKLKGQPAWNKGLTKETDERLYKISESMKGHTFTDEHNLNLSKARKDQYANGYAPRWINDGQQETTIQEGEPLPEHFVYGRLGKKDTYIYKGDIGKKIAHSELSLYLEMGWKRGRPASVSQSIRNSLNIIKWEYEGKVFSRALDLAQYLNEHGYPDIVDSTITSLYIKGFEKSPKYCSLAGKIRKIVNEDKINSAD